MRPPGAPGALLSIEERARFVRQRTVGLGKAYLDRPMRWLGGSIVDVRRVGDEVDHIGRVVVDHEVAAWRAAGFRRATE